MEILGKVEEQDQYLQLQESFDDPAAQVEEETNYLDQEDCQPDVSEKPLDKPQVSCKEGTNIWVCFDCRYPPL